MKCRPTSYDLPPKDNVYGIKMTGLGEGAASGKFITQRCCRPSSFAISSSVPSLALAISLDLATVMGNLEVHTASKPAVSDQDLVRCNRMAVKKK